VPDVRPPWSGACPSRRSLLRGLGALGGVLLAPGVLTACGSSGDPASGGNASSARGSIPAADVPVGQARVVDVGGQRVVVAQPADGEYTAFSARCTHQGTPVQAGEGLVLTCPSHGSSFDAGAGGAVVTGPATEPLPGVPVRREGDQLVLG
jgi:Rieske Fe-S protein